MTEPDLPVVDASTCAVIDDDAAESFRRNGLLVIRNVVSARELARLQGETSVLVDEAVDGGDDPDFRFKTHDLTGETVPFRVEYVVDKLPSARALAGHPFILRTVEKLQGPAFIPTWDSMVFKMGGAGAAIPWHRDGGLFEGSVEKLRTGRVFNVDIYLDKADLGNCLWGLPGSNNWSEEEAAGVIARMNADGRVSTDGAVPLPMNPGDVLLHNVMLVHGSQATTGPLRRVLYYEYRPIDIELEHGPHNPEYVRAKQHVLAATLRYRRRDPVSRGEKPFEYRPGGHADPRAWAEDPPTFRYPHEHYLLAAAGAGRS